MAEKVIGIIGGMGPEATLDLFGKMIRANPVKRDQDQIRIIVDCNGKIPDRVKAIFEKAEDPTDALIKTAQNLERAGAQLLTIACNAAHYYHKKITQSVSIPVLNMQEETATYCQRHFPRVKTFGLLAGSSTILLELYHKAFARIQANILTPKPDDQEKVMEAIYKIKANDLGPSVKAGFLKVAQNLEAMGAKAIILGCTEVPVVCQDGDLPGLPFVDANRVLAESAVALARG